ncbi:transcriptional regulator, TrmB family [Lachnospiraceae bacterium KM106-2]|nr:transcriptional regulator, TrmB family [Lachnospiraceae bacterium KM106-2]
MVEQLMMFGLTRQEATIYIALLSEGTLSGYETAKVTGISRSNTYNALAGLVEKGAAYIIEENAAKYTPVAVKEFCDNKLFALQNIEDELVKNLPKEKEETQGYITIKGDHHILDKMRNMLVGAKSRVYISVSQAILIQFEQELKQLLDHEIKVVVLSEESFGLEGAIFYHKKVPAGQIRLIVDSVNVLTGEIRNEDGTCLYSKNKNLVDVFKEMLKNEIKLISMTSTT